jgi:hypothetical protein
VKRAARILAVMPAVVGLGWLAEHSVESGAAGSTVFDAGVAMRLLSATRAPLRESDALADIREALLKAQATTPRDPALHELLGLIDARRGERREYLPQADVDFTNAIRFRPTSPQTWSNLAAVKYQMGDTGPAFQAAIGRAVELGRFEPDVQGIVANYGLAVWSEVGPSTRASVEAILSAAMKRNPLEMLQIAERRGRLDFACRYLTGSTRQIDLKWSQLCQSMEATS